MDLALVRKTQAWLAVHAPALQPLFCLRSPRRRRLLIAPTTSQGDPGGLAIASGVARPPGLAKSSIVVILTWAMAKGRH